MKGINIMQYQIGVSRWGFELSESTFEKLRESNIRGLELAAPAERYKEFNYKEIEALAKKYDITLWSYHLPLQFSPLPEIDPSSLDKTIRDNTIEYLSELIKKGSDIGIDKFIIHASGEPIRDPAIRSEKIKYAMQSLDTLAEIAFESDSYLAVENLPRTCLGNTADDVLQLISANDKLKVCFDTNHSLKDSNIDFMDKLADKIITVHISDYDFINERHWLPGAGKVEWNALFSKFQEIGYNGMWLYEVPLHSPENVIRDNPPVHYTFSQVYENAMNIFSGNKPVV